MGAAPPPRGHPQWYGEKDCRRIHSLFFRRSMSGLDYIMGECSEAKGMSVIMMHFIGIIGYMDFYLIEKERGEMKLIPISSFR